MNDCTAEKNSNGTLTKRVDDQALLNQIELLLSLLPKVISGAIADSGTCLSTYFETEISIASELTIRIRNDLLTLKNSVSDKEPPNNVIRSLKAQVLSDKVPSTWLAYSNSNIGHFIGDLCKRTEQLELISKSKQLASNSICLHWLFDINAYLTVLQQFTANTMKFSIEKLVLHCQIDAPKNNGCYFVMRDASIEGAIFTDGKFVLTDAVTAVKLDVCYLFWSDEPINHDNVTDIPVYSSGDRSKFLFYCQIDSKIGKDVIKRGVALIV